MHENDNGYLATAAILCEKDVKNLEPVRKPRFSTSISMIK